MEKVDLKKNKLDKEYDFESKKAMVWFTLGTITLVGFVATMLIYEQYIYAGVFGFLILICAYILFRKREKRVREILEEIKDLS